MTILDDATAYAIAKQALPHWHFSAPKLNLISRSENIVFRVDTSDDTRYVLRIHRPGYHTLDELNAEQDWTTALNRSGLSVPVAVKMHERIGASDGYASVSVPNADETRFVGVVEWFEGEVLRNIMEEANNDDAMSQYFHQLGQIAARVHNQSAGWTPPSKSRRHELDADGLVGDAPFWGRFWDLPQFSSNEGKRLSEIRAKLHKMLTDLGKDPHIYSLIHADLHPGNLLIRDETPHVIDFDDCAYSWHIYELAVSLFYSWDEPYFEAIRDAMIAGYRTERTLLDEMVALLPVFLLIRCLSLIGWTHERPELGRHERIPKLVTKAIEQADLLGL